MLLSSPFAPSLLCSQTISVTVPKLDSSLTLATVNVELEPLETPLEAYDADSIKAELRCAGERPGTVRICCPHTFPLTARHPRSPLSAIESEYADHVKKFVLGTTQGDKDIFGLAIGQGWCQAPGWCGRGSQRACVRAVRSTHGCFLSPFPGCVGFNTGERDLDAVLRPRVALLAGLRGNEVGGTEIIMRLARSLLTTELKGVLSRVTVLLIPRVNHDG